MSTIGPIHPAHIALSQAEVRVVEDKTANANIATKAIGTDPAKLFRALLKDRRARTFVRVPRSTGKSKPRTAYTLMTPCVRAVSAHPVVQCRSDEIRGLEGQAALTVFRNLATSCLRRLLSPDSD
jgi:hypothetical protein